MGLNKNSIILYFGLYIDSGSVKVGRALVLGLISFEDIMDASDQLKTTMLISVKG